MSEYWKEIPNVKVINSPQYGFYQSFKHVESMSVKSILGRWIMNRCFSFSCWLYKSVIEGK